MGVDGAVYKVQMDHQSLSGEETQHKLTPPYTQPDGAGHLKHTAWSQSPTTFRLEIGLGPFDLLVDGQSTPMETPSYCSQYHTALPDQTDSHSLLTALPVSSRDPTPH